MSLSRLHIPLAEAGCTEAQGYFFGQPESATELRRWFEEPSRAAPFLRMA